jgi:hypothetical protein
VTGNSFDARSHRRSLYLLEFVAAKQISLDPNPKSEIRKSRLIETIELINYFHNVVIPSRAEGEEAHGCNQRFDVLSMINQHRCDPSLRSG